MAVHDWLLSRSLLQAPQPLKQPNVQELQFYQPRLFELLDQWIYLYRQSTTIAKVVEGKTPEKNPRRGGSSVA